MKTLMAPLLDLEGSLYCLAFFQPKSTQLLADSSDTDTAGREQNHSPGETGLRQ